MQRAGGRVRFEGAGGGVRAGDGVAGVEEGRTWGGVRLVILIQDWEGEGGTGQAGRVG